MSKKKEVKIAPSILSADFGYLHETVLMLNRSAADWVHCDIMDGSFVPNISFGFPVLQAINKASEMPLDVHLMIQHPEAYITLFQEVGASVLTVHYEACMHIHRVIQQIRAVDMQPGVAINPGTPIEVLREILPEVDLVCLMAVNPGFGGQLFIEGTFDKLRRLDALRSELNPKCKIEIDGGVNLNNASQLIALGADILVAGNSIFGAPEPEEVINRLKKAAH